MKLKYYLRGLGTGILLTALLLGIYTGFGKQMDLTDSQIIQKAEGLGMIKKEDTLNLDSLVPNPSLSPSKSPKEKATANPSKSPKEKATASPSESPKEKATENPSESTKSAKISHQFKNSIHTIMLPQGLNSKDIAANLEQWGIIDSAKDFDNYLTTSGYDRKISFGKFTISPGASYANIAKILTRPDK